MPLKRTFAAKLHPVGSPERARLNLRAETSEYMPSHRWAVEMWHRTTFARVSTTWRSRSEAEADEQRCAALGYSTLNPGER